MQRCHAHLWIAAALCLGVAAPAQAQRLKIATVVPEGSAWMREMRAAAKEVVEKTDGRVRIKLYPGGVMGSEATVLRKMRAGQLQGGAFASGSLKPLYRGSDVYSIPLMFRSYEEVDFVRSRMDAALREGLERSGLVVLAISDGGFAHLLSQKPLRSTGDLRGTKVWALEDDVMTRTALEIAGVSPVPLAIGDVYTGLQTGLIDTVAVPPMAAIAFQWHTKVKYFTDVPLMYLVGVLVVDGRAFDRLRPQDQQVVREVVGASAERLDQASRVGHLQARQALIEQGIEPVAASSAQELERWHDIADRTLVVLRTTGVYSEGLIAALLASLDAYRELPPAAADEP